MYSHPIKLDLIAEVYDKDGKLIKKISSNSKPEGKDNIELTKLDTSGNVIEKRVVPMRSFVRNFLSHYNALCNNVAAIHFTQTNGSAVNTTTSYPNNAMTINAAINNTTYGIMIGTGSSAVSASNYKLDYQLPNTMTTHAAVTFETASAYGNGYKFAVKRLFNNITAGDITITEVGLAFLQDYNTGFNPAERYALMMRDIIDSGSNTIDFILSASQNVEVKYNIFVDGTSGLTYNYIRMLSGVLSDANISYPLKSVYYNGTSILEKNYNFSLGNDTQYNFLTSAGAGNSIYGIVVGSGTASISIEDYKLESKYEHGATANTLDYGLMSYTSSYAGSGSMAMQTRTFINNSGEPITIREAAIYSWGTGSSATPPITSSASSYLCIARKLTGDVILQDQQSVNISFVFNTSTE